MTDFLTDEQQSELVSAENFIKQINPKTAPFDKDLDMPGVVTELHSKVRILVDIIRSIDIGRQAETPAPAATATPLSEEGFAKIEELINEVLTRVGDNNSNIVGLTAMVSNIIGGRGEPGEVSATPIPRDLAEVPTESLLGAVLATHQGRLIRKRADAQAIVASIINALEKDRADRNARKDRKAKDEGDE